MTWNDEQDRIKPGDVMVKRWGQRNLVHVMLPRNSRSAKQPYMILSSGGIDSTYTNYRSRYGNTTTDRRWCYVGTIPTAYLNELIERRTLGPHPPPRIMLHPDAQRIVGPLRAILLDAGWTVEELDRYHGAYTALELAAAAAITRLHSFNKETT